LTFPLILTLSLFFFPVYMDAVEGSNKEWCCSATCTSALPAEWLCDSSKKRPLQGSLCLGTWCCAPAQQLPREQDQRLIAILSLLFCTTFSLSFPLYPLTLVLLTHSFSCRSALIHSLFPTRPRSSLVPPSFFSFSTRSSFLLCSSTPLHSSFSPLSSPPCGTNPPFALLRHFTHSLPFFGN